MIGTSKRVIVIVEVSETVYRNLKVSLLRHGIQAVELNSDSARLSSAITNGFGLAMIRACHGTSYVGAVQLIRDVRQFDPDASIVLLVDQSSEEKVLNALRAGVTDYFRPPVPDDELIASLNPYYSVRPNGADHWWVKVSPR